MPPSTLSTSQTRRSSLSVNEGTKLRHNALV
jgi:hypothetical protein